MALYKVVLTDNIFPDLEIEKNMLDKVGAELVLVPPGDNICDYVADADVVVNTYAKVTADVVNRMQKCKMVIRNGIGVDTIDVDACTRKGIIVSNVPHYCSDEVATHTMALMLAVTRKLKALDNSVSRGQWDVKRAMPLFSLEDKTLGLIGFGKIPRLIIEKARVFGMRVIAYDPYISKADMNACHAKKVSLDDLLAQSDVVSLHCPLNESTRNMIDLAAFKKMKSSAYLINVARGPIVNEADLVTALEEGLIAGAGLDLLTENAVDVNNPLLKFEQVIITPHCAWYSEESIIRRRTQTMENVVAVLQGGMPMSLCNLSNTKRKFER